MSKDLAFEIAETYVDILQAFGDSLRIYLKPVLIRPTVQALNSFRGPGLEKGLSGYADIKKHFNVPISYSCT